MITKKWIKIFTISLLITAVFICSFNYIIDPFGVFGDNFLKWYSYDMVNNPRIAKIAYLDKYNENYDSYIIGGSKSSSISPALLNKYYGDANFYSMMMYGGDFYDYEKTMHYLIENYEVKNIVIHMSMHEISHYNEPNLTINTELSAKVTGDSLFQFYFKFLTLNLKYSFKKLEGLLRRKIDSFEYSQIKPEDGVYNKIRRDAEDLGTLEEFLLKYPEFKNELPKVTGDAIDNNVDALMRMKNYCEERNITFLLITAPTYYKEMDKYNIKDVITYWKKLASVTEFWDFTGYTSISYDARHFYDRMHYRNSIGEMMLARIFNNENLDIPEDFGHYTTKENVDEYLKSIYPDYSYLVNEDVTSVKVPIVSYHNIDTNKDNLNEITIPPEKFKEDMLKIKEAGYNTIFFKDLLNYVNGISTLPEKPIIIIFDDGYLSNYEYAYPILKELEMKATISIIGWSVGRSKYIHIDKNINPHFTWEQAKEMYDSGYVDIQSHSYDMHGDNEEEYPYRKGVLQTRDESFTEYINFFKEDCIKQKQLIESNIGNEVFVFTYPYGYYNELTEKLLRDLGYKITVTVDNGTNQISKDKKSLFKLKRINAVLSITSEDLVKILDS